MKRCLNYKYYSLLILLSSNAPAALIPIFKLAKASAISVEAMNEVPSDF